MKKSLLIAGLALTAGLTAWGKPALKIPLTVTQPDGSKLTIVKRGNAACKSIYTLDGYLLERDDRKGYVYALPQGDGTLVASDMPARNAEWRTDAEVEFLSTVSREEINEAVAAFGMKAKDANRFMLKSRVPAFAQGLQKDTRGPGLYDYSFPCKGKQKVLVILAEFADVKFNSKNKSPYNKIDSKTYFTEMLNKDGFNTYGGTGSAHEWFIQNSNGLFDPEFDVYGPVTLPQNVKYYGGNDRDGNDKAAHQMVIDACKALDSEINFKDYDRDDNGYVDNVYVFYAGYGEADTEGQEDTIWPHSWEISSATAPNANVQGDPLELDGVYIDRYACSNETCGIIGYDSNYNCIYADRPDGIGTFVHEFSHVMGLPDLYSTAEYSSYRNVPFTPEEFSVMDYGPYNNDGMTPPNYSAYERYALDWVTPDVMTSGSHSLGNLGDMNQAFIVKTDREQEFYLFENRQQTGWDKYIPGHGMLVWHVDFDQTVFYNNEVNNTKTHQYVDLVEADNIQDGPTGVDLWGDFVYPATTRTGDPFPGSKNVRTFGASTTPALKSWSGKTLGVELSGISESNGVVSFVAAVDGSGVNDVATDTTILSGDVYDLRGIKVGTVVDGRMPVLDAGIYVVRSGNKLNKIAVR